MAIDSRAWQRSLKNGKIDAYARVGGNSVRLIGDGEVVRAMLAAFAVKTEGVLDFQPPQVIDGQTTIFEEMGVA